MKGKRRIPLSPLWQKKETTTVRQVWEESIKCLETIRKLLEHPSYKIRIKNVGEHWCIEGLLRAGRVTPQMPVFVAKFSILGTPNGGGTRVEITRSLTPEYREWENRTEGILAGLFLLAFFLGIIYILSAVRFINTNQGTPSNALVSVALALLAVVFALIIIFEAGRGIARSRLARLDPDLRRALEAVGTAATLDQKETRAVLVRLEPKFWTLLFIFIALQTIIILALLRSWMGVAFIFLVTFLVLPYILARHCAGLARRLPGRYEFKARRLELAAGWYFFITLPLIYLPADLLVPGCGTLSFVGFSIIFSIGLILGLPGSARRIRETYGGVLRNPSLGYEAVVPASSELKEFRNMAMGMLSMMAVVTHLGILGACVALRWKSPHPLVIFCNYPLVHSLAVWVSRLSSRLVVRLRPLPVGKGELLDLLVRPGLHREVQSSLGNREVSFRWGKGARFGAAISRRGFFRTRYLLFLDKEILSSVREPRQREALIWHEVAHQMSPHRWILHELAFGIWAEHVRSALSDSLLEETRCDTFVVQRGLGNELLQALEIIHEHVRRSGVVSPQRDEDASDSISGILGLASGEERLDQWHPHLEVRIKVLRQLVEQYLS